jgi:hypothetical protein
MPTVLEVRQALVDRGYTPLPLFGKEPPIYGKNNRRGGFAAWQTLENVSREQIAMWSKTWPDANNTGILTPAVPDYRYRHS